MKNTILAALSATTILLADSAYAATYEYTGLPFDSFISDPNMDVDYSTSDSVSGSFTLNNSLAADSALADISFLDGFSFSFSDGKNTYTDANSSIEDFRVGTSGGIINEWSIFLSETSFPVTSGYEPVFRYLYTANECGGFCVQDEGSEEWANSTTGAYIDEAGSILDQPGGWALAQSVPEVSASGSLAAIGTLLALMAFLFERRDREPEDTAIAA